MKIETLAYIAISLWIVSGLLCIYNGITDATRPREYTIRDSKINIEKVMNFSGTGNEGK